MTELEGEPDAGGDRTPRTAQAGSAVGAEASTVNFGEVQGAVYVYHGATPPAVPPTPGLNAAIIGTTLLSAKGTYRLDTASLSHAYLGNIGPSNLSVVDRVRENLGLRVLAELESARDLPAALAAMIDFGSSVGDEVAVVGPATE